VTQCFAEYADYSRYLSAQSYSYANCVLFCVCCNVRQLRCCCLCRVTCKTVTETSIPSHSCVDRVHFDLNVAKLLSKCQRVKLLFAALQSHRESQV